MVELLLVRDGMSSTEMRTSGPGSPMSKEWKLSSVIDDGAVEMQCASDSIGDLGDGKAEECVKDHGLTGPVDAVGRFKGLTLTGAKSLGRKAWRGEGVAEPEFALPGLEPPAKYGGLGSSSSPSS